MERRSAIRRGGAQVWPLLSRIIDSWQRHNIGMLARQAAYSLLYALPAMIALLVSLAAVLDRYTSTGFSTLLRQAIDTRAPEELQPLLNSIVQYTITEQDSTTAAISALIAFGFALWGGAGGANALIYACNRVYDVTSTRSWIVSKLLALALTFAGGGLVIVAFALILVGERISDWITDSLGRNPSALNLLLSSWVGPAALLFLSVSVLYLLAPDVPVSLLWVAPGAALASIATLLAFAGFDLIIRVISPGSAFGAAGSVLILLWMLDLVSTFVITGAMLTAVVRERYDTRLIAWLDGHPERRLPPVT